MAHTNAEKRQDEETDIRAALEAVGIRDPDLMPGGDPPDFVLRFEGRLIPLEHTRLYLDHSGSSPQARARLWQRLKTSVRAAALPVALELDFAMEGGWPNVPPSARHVVFAAGLADLAQDRPAPFVVSGTELPAPLSPYLSRVVGRASKFKGEVSGTPDASFLAVPPFDPIRACIVKKAALMQGKVSGAWLIIVLGADLSQPILGVGEIEQELTSINLASGPLERVYVVDISLRLGYLLQDGAWRRAV